MHSLRISKASKEIYAALDSSKQKKVKKVNKKQVKAAIKAIHPEPKPVRVPLQPKKLMDPPRLLATFPGPHKTGKPSSTAKQPHKKRFQPTKAKRNSSVLNLLHR
jgi:hypothetical protein